MVKFVNKPVILLFSLDINNMTEGLVGKDKGTLQVLQVTTNFFHLIHTM